MSPYREKAKSPSCTASNATGMLIGCKHTATHVCTCRKCANEPELAFYTCGQHVLECGAKHLRIYDRPPTWIKIQPPSIMDLIPPKKTESSIDPELSAILSSEYPIKDLIKDDWGGAKQW